jgi:hypothetical protein
MRLGALGAFRPHVRWSICDARVWTTPRHWGMAGGYQTCLNLDGVAWAEDYYLSTVTGMESREIG